MKKDLKYYLNLPYTHEIKRDPDGGYTGNIKELSGCITQGESEVEVLQNLHEAFELWIETALEKGIKINEPSEEDYSGKFVLRIPKSLHRKLSEKAESEGVSLNQYLVYLLSEQDNKDRNSFTLKQPNFLGEEDFCIEPIERMSRMGFRQRGPWEGTVS